MKANEVDIGLVVVAPEVQEWYKGTRVNFIGKIIEYEVDFQHSECIVGIQSILTGNVETGIDCTNIEILQYL